MPDQEDTSTKQNQTKSSLKNLQTNLAEAKKNYKRQEIKFEQFRIQASQLMQIDQQGIKVLPITFKKSKSLRRSQHPYSET